MSKVRADQYTNKEGTGAPSFPNGVSVTGIITATSFSGSLAGSASTATVATNAYGLVGGPNISVGNITASGNVSVAGTITSEDVTNVDSVGMVTARNGVKVLAGGINAVGVVTATSFSGSGANLTGIDAAPTVQLLTSENLVAGDSVALKTNGQLEKVESTVTPLSPIEMSNQTIDGSGLNAWTEPAVAWDSENSKLVEIYEESGNYIRLRYGSIAGNSISWTTINTNVVESAYQRSIAYIGGSKFIIIYSKESDKKCHAVVVTMSYGGSGGFSLGTIISIHPNETRHVDIESYGTDKAVAVYRSQYDSNVYARPLSVSGTDITAGTEVSYSTSSTLADVQLRRLGSTAKFLVIWQQSGNVFTGQMGSYDTSTNTVTKLGSSVTIQSGTLSTYHSLAYTKDNKFLVQYSGISGYQYSAVLTHDGSNSFSVGTIATTDNHLNTYCCVVYDSDADKGIMIFKDLDVGSGSLWCRPLTISGTTVSAGNRLEINGTNGCNIGPRGAVYIPWAGNTFGTYPAEGNAWRDYWFRVSAATITSNFADFLGFSGGSFSANSTATIQIIGNINTNQSGLTIGQLYYVQKDGSVGLTALNPSVLAGRAISATSIIVGY